MSKEMVISATPHETRVAILEDGQLCEVYVEREKEFALVGSIYKGRVTRVLPGMQSAFVEIGLDSDAFLYVSDFLEGIEEYDQVVSTVEEKMQKMEEQGGQVFAPAASGEASAVEPPGVVAPAEPAESEPGAAAQTSTPQSTQTGAPRFEPRSHDRPSFGRGRDRHGRGRRNRRGHGGDRNRGRELPPAKYASHRPYEPEPSGPSENYEPIILPGESLAKYKNRTPEPQAAATPASEQLPSQPVTVAEAPPAFAEPFAGLEPLPGESIAKAHKSEPPAESAKSAHEVDAVAPTAVPDLEPSKFTEPSQPASGEEALPEQVSEAAVEEIRREADLTAEEATALAEQVAEAQLEEAVREEQALEDAAAEDEAAEGFEESEETPETSAAAIEAVETSETPDEAASRAMGFEAAPGEQAEPAAAENEPGDQARPWNARVRGDSRAHLHHPARRGRRREAPRSRPQGHRPQQRRPQLISELLKQGQEIIVQIAKEPLGKKGARITSHIALPGRYLVYMPTLDHTGVSRKIASAEQRARLRQLVNEAKGSAGGGFIVRTAAEHATPDEIRADVEFLARTWNDIKTRAEQRKAPALLHRDLNLVERILRDYLSPDYTAIWVDSEEEFTKVVDFVSRFQPQLVNRVKLYTKETPVYEEFGIQQEIDKGLRPKVWLKSGGYIVINHTEALVAIDVNTGKYVGRGSTRLEDTIVRTNLEAVKEIVRQIRLRDLGGIIIIDFIDMEERRNRDKVMAALEEALKTDRAPSKVLRFNEFGLVAITRKRTKQALERTLCQPCPYCTGSGMVKSVPTLCYEIQTEARKMAPEIEAGSITLRVHPEIAKALKTRESGLVEELERWTHKSIIIQADPTLHWEQYDIY